MTHTNELRKRFVSSGVDIKRIAMSNIESEIKRNVSGAGMRAKQYLPFSQVNEGTYFLTKRYPNSAVEADSLKFYKETKEDSNAWNPEFGEQLIHQDQECWIYI